MGYFSSAHFASNHFGANHWQQAEEAVEPPVFVPLPRPVEESSSGGGGDGVVVVEIEKRDRTSSAIPGQFLLSASLSAAADFLEAEPAAPEELALAEVLPALPEVVPGTESAGEPRPTVHSKIGRPGQFAVSVGVSVDADFLEPEPVSASADFRASLSVAARAAFETEQTVAAAASIETQASISVAADAKDVLRFAVTSTDMFSKSEDADFSVVGDDDFDLDD